MDRFKDLDLECDGAGVAEKAALFSGMFKTSFRSTESSVQAKDSLSAEGELSESNDSLTDKEKGGLFPGKFRKTTKAAKEAQPQEAGGMFSGMFKKSPKPFRAKPQSQGDLSVPSELSGSNDNLSDMNELAEVKLNPFRSANKSQTCSDDEDPPASSEMSSGDKQRETEEALKENEKHVEEKPKAVKSNMIQQERKERSATPPVPRRPTEEEMKRASTYDKVKPRGTEDNQDFKDMISREKQARPADTPVVPARPSEEELNRAARPGLQKQKSNQAPFDNEGLKEDDSSSKEEKKEEEDKDKTEETNVKKPKRHNPFMPRVKGRVIQRQAQDGAAGNTEENEGGNRSLFDRLEDFRIDPAQPEGGQDVDNLMEWWNSVESWEDAPQDDDMTEKEEAKAFAVTADKVQKGIRVFNKLFSERAESLWQHVIDLNSIADGLDKFSKNTKIAQITGGSTSAIGGVATITGLALAPFTMGASLIVTAVGLGVTTAGGLTSAGAGISSQVNNSMDRKKVEKIVQDYQEKMVDLNKCLTFIKQGIENLKKFNLMKMKKNAFNRDFPALTSSVYEDGAMAGKAIVINAFEIMRVVQIANVAGSTAARAVQIASMATGVLTGLFVGMDIYFVAKDSKELKKGAKSEFAAKIREVTMQLHEGLVELNGIRGELQSTTPENNTGNHTAALDSNKKEKDEKL